MNKYELAGQNLIKENSISVKTVRKSMSGVAYIEDKTISAPRPNSPLKFAIFAHEIGHIVNGHVTPRWKEELKAWEFSIAQFKRYRIRLTKDVKSRINYSLAFALAKALNRNMKVIPKELHHYKKYLSPIVYIYGDGHRANKWHADYL